MVYRILQILDLQGFQGFLKSINYCQLDGGIRMACKKSSVRSRLSPPVNNTGNEIYLIKD